MSREGCGRKDHGGRWRGEEINRATKTQNLTVRLSQRNQDYSTMGRKKIKTQKASGNITIERNIQHSSLLGKINRILD